MLTAAQSPSIGSFTVFLACICAFNILSKYEVRLMLSKLGMGGVTRFRLAIYHWQKKISMAHGLFRLYLPLKTQG